jgi:dephospho-CoA kinase
MLLVGLTGGIGTGKSTVARMLAERGAVVIDADELARKALEPGSPVLDRVLAEFGDEIRRPDGSIDRNALAARVFADVEARRTLEGIIHPEVMRLMAEEIERHRGGGGVVVLDVPLLIETGVQAVCDVVVVVSSALEKQVERLVASRSMSERDVRARIAAQAPIEEKEAAADIVIRNDRSIGELEAEVDELWRGLHARATGA